MGKRSPKNHQPLFLCVFLFKQHLFVVEFYDLERKDDFQLRLQAVKSGLGIQQRLCGFVV